jgi:hypothetical protein
MAEWLYNELDNPANWQPAAPGARNSSGREYRLPNSGDETVRVFYLSHTETFGQLQEMATVIRSLTGIRRLFPYSDSTPRALAMRGTGQQIALAEQLIKERDKSDPPKVAR